MVRSWSRGAAVGSLVGLALLAGARPAAGDDPPGLVQAAPPPLSDGAFPCSGCHADQKPSALRRELTYHAEQQAMLAHDPQRWCLDCHDLEDRDRLRLVSGARVSFEESYRLCGQCHGDKHRSWRAGVHGKRTGRWDGEKTYLLCVNCHDPHAPRFKGVAEVVVNGKPTVAPSQRFLTPMPRPLRPEEQRR
jgi:hypothetical protein